MELHFVGVYIVFLFTSTVAQDYEQLYPNNGQISNQAASVAENAFIHPGALHTEVDFDRMRTAVAGELQPWLAGWNMLVKNRHAQLDWKARPADGIYRGKNPTHGENYGQLFNDIAAGYALALRWKVSGNDSYADKAISILDAWSSALKVIGGNSDRFLAAGIYGYEFANVAEIMRSYTKWPQESLARFQNMMLTVFYPTNHDFLTRHNGAKIDHYWANWDLCNMASILAIGILTERRDLYNEAIEYFKNGKGNGGIQQLIVNVYPEEGLAQTQESGRDQGHNVMNVGLVGAFCQMAWNQGDDLFSYNGNVVLMGMEYIAKYNLGYDVPFTRYANSDVVHQGISPAGRGNKRPVWELFCHHYVAIKGLNAPNICAAANDVRPEGGGGDYGPNSGGFDQLGYGTLTFSLG